MKALSIVTLFVFGTLIAATTAWSQDPPGGPANDSPAAASNDDPAPAPEETAPAETAPGDADSPGEPPAASPQEALARLQKEWENITRQMARKREEFKAAGEEERNDLYTQYAALATRSQVVLAELRDAALSAVAAAPEDDSVIKLLLGILLYDVREANFRSVLRTADALIDQRIDKEWFRKAAADNRLSPEEKTVFDEILIRYAESEAGDLPRVKLSTSEGDITLELFENEAPNTVANFISLVEQGLYDGTEFHRVIDGFMAQGGDPNSKNADPSDDGTGGPGYYIRCECYEPDARKHYPGSLAMAHGTDRDTGGSQFYIAFDRTSTRHLDGKHTVFGRVIDGMDAVDRLQTTEGFGSTGKDRDKIVKAEVLRKREHDYKPETLPKTTP